MTTPAQTSRQRRRTPSLEAASERYATPDGETTPARRRRQTNRRQARSRFHRRREELMIAAGSSDTFDHSVPAEAPQDSTTVSQVNVEQPTSGLSIVDEEQKGEPSDEDEEQKGEPSDGEEEKKGESFDEEQKRAGSNSDVEDEQDDAPNPPPPIRPRRRRVPRPQPLCALATIEDFVEPDRHRLLPRDIICPHCHALLWPDESRNACCLKGDVVLPPFQHPPEEIKRLFSMPSFIRKIRPYNMAFSFTSLGASLNENVRIDENLANQSDGVYTFRLQGAMCHRIGTLAPPDGRPPAFAQLYFLDAELEERVRLRMSAMDGLDRGIVRMLEAVLQELNSCARLFKSAKQRWEELGCPLDYSIRLVDVEGADPRRYNAPVAPEVAGIMVDGGSASRSRDIVVHYRGRGGLQRIYETNPLYDTLQYPLILLRGEHGWSPEVRYSRPTVTRYNNNKVSCREFYAYRLYEKREGQEGDGYSLIHGAGRLMQQYVVDQGAKIIDQRLFYQRTHQSEFRGSLLEGVADAAGDDLQQIGTHVILSPSFTGGERYMLQLYYDAMAIVRANCKPDLFITVTCNPEWDEIRENVFPGQKAEDRADIVARVFRLKLKSISNDITKRHIFGETIAHLFVIEFQKRGLPHAHILLILSESAKPRTPADYDKIVCAEIPDAAIHPNLHATVTTCMMHGPCGYLRRNAPCMKKEVCSKRYPKTFSDETRADGDGYPVYRRRDTGRYVERGRRNMDQVGGTSRIQLDNRWVVPYNPYLSAKYDCHINVEICSTITSVKYLYKYVYKGQDRTNVAIGGQRRDEIQLYVDARYLSPPEACWRIFEFPLQEKSHSVERLPVHLMALQYVTFRSTDAASDVQERSQHTKLTRFFDLCARDPRARGLLYHQVPELYVWDRRSKNWTWR